MELFIYLLRYDCNLDVILVPVRTVKTYGKLFAVRRALKCWYRLFSLQDSNHCISLVDIYFQITPMFVFTN